MKKLSTEEPNDSAKEETPGDDSVVHISTDGIKDKERAEFWQETVCKNFVEVQFASRVAPDFSGDLLSRKLGDLRFSVVEAVAHSVQSTGKKNGGPQENYVYGMLILEGRALVTQDEREARLQRGDLTFYDATRPHHLVFDQDVKMLLVDLPQEHLRHHVAGLEHCTTRRIDGHAGIGAVISSFMHSLTAHIGDINAASQPHLANCVLDLVSTSLSSIKPEGPVPPRSRTFALYRVKEFVEHHLADPELNTAAISQGVGLSPRYINKLFEEMGSSCSLSGYVWGRRLEHCHEDLQNPAYLVHRISDIALRWGFNDFSHFSRAFKARYGMSPRDFRDQAIGRK